LYDGILTTDARGNGQDWFRSIGSDNASRDAGGDGCPSPVAALTSLRYGIESMSRQAGNGWELEPFDLVW
jgi:hypothetical protein